MNKATKILFALLLTLGLAAEEKKVDKQIKTKAKDTCIKKSHYIDLMEITLSAYSTGHIDRYINDVRRDGLKEHGFPRLTANIGILMAHGRRQDLKERFISMMDLCCQQFLKVKAGNEFSVKEIIFCLQELDKTNVISSAKLQEWKKLLAKINPYASYKIYAKSPEDNVFNWAAFSMLSEYMRQAYGLTNAYSDFIDLQAFSQLRHLDENQMYRDPNEPIAYDMVTRGIFAMLLDEGYQGKYQKEWKKCLEATAMPTLYMQSVTGEMPYGGRSNQFVHNEAHVALLMEYYAKTFARKGDMVTAGKFKAAAQRALEYMALWLNKEPITHIKNRFPRNSNYGCERYAYFDKYMITTASFLYFTYRLSDDTISVGELDDKTGVSWQSSDAFHKVFLRAGEYFAEYDYKADYHHDCNGMGRLHKKGAPSELCLSTPCPTDPHYTLDISNSSLLAIAPGICKDGKWQYGTAADSRHIVKSHQAAGETAATSVECVFPGGETVQCNYLLNKDGLQVSLSGKGSLRCLLPVFRFNGEEHTKVTVNKNTLEVVFNGWVCRYMVENGSITDLNLPARNRNGHYDSFAAEGNGELKVQIAIEKSAYIGKK
ncbi:MAG: hypothetical protein IJZ19_01250 [Lentisphaeria bacterium]|nr:hypothetical protein [Lentisphaeria bacterium]